MSRKELEELLIALCHDVRRYQETYERLRDLQGNVLGINTLGNPDGARLAKIALADLVGTQAIEADSIWRSRIVRAADQITEGFESEVTK